MDDETLAPFALNYKLVKPAARVIAKQSFAGKVHGTAEQAGEPVQKLRLNERWNVTVTYGVPQFWFRGDAAGQSGADRRGADRRAGAGRIPGHRRTTRG